LLPVGSTTLTEMLAAEEMWGSRVATTLVQLSATLGEPHWLVVAV
jgi:hypothetical protein